MQLAAVMLIVLGNTLASRVKFIRHYTLPLVAFVGSVLVTLLVHRLANFQGRTDMATLLLAGVAINALMGQLQEY